MSRETFEVGTLAGINVRNMRHMSWSSRVSVLGVYVLAMPLILLGAAAPHDYTAMPAFWFWVLGFPWNVWFFLGQSAFFNSK